MKEKKKGLRKLRRVALRLFVAGNAPNSRLAIANIRAICETHFAGSHELEIIDLLVNPAAALANGIIVTPTLIRLTPLPVRKFIGNLSETNKVLLALGDT